MLTVTDNGLKIALEPTNLKSELLTHILIVGAISTVLGILMMLGWLPLIVGVSLIIVALFGDAVWQILTHRLQPIHLSGGELLITPWHFIHYQTDKVTEYRIQPTDNLQRVDDALYIFNVHGKPLYQITGFSHYRQLEAADAVLQGNPIQLQGKTIRLQPTN